LFVALTSAKAAWRVVLLVMMVYLALMLAVLPVIFYFWLRPVQSVLMPARSVVPSQRADQRAAMFLAVALVGILIALFATLAGLELRCARDPHRAGRAGDGHMGRRWGAAQSHAGDPRELMFGPEATAPSCATWPAT